MITKEQDLLDAIAWLERNGFSSSKNESPAVAVLKIKGWSIFDWGDHDGYEIIGHRDDTKSARLKKSIAIAPWFVESLKTECRYQLEPTVKIPEGAKWAFVDDAWVLYWNNTVCKVPRLHTELKELEKTSLMTEVCLAACFELTDRSMCRPLRGFEFSSSTKRLMGEKTKGEVVTR